MAQSPQKKRYLDIHEWLIAENIKNEKGERIEFDSHPFLFDIYADRAQYLTIMKAAQVGLSTAAIFKNHYDAKQEHLDIIYCVDEETEILTKRGFLKQVDLLNTDIILTLPKNGIAQWLRPNEIFRKEVVMDCIRFDARNFDALVTPNHRWLLRPYRGRGQMFFRETKDMIGKYARIPKVVEIGATPTKIHYADEYIELLAWVFSEGYYCKQVGKNDNSIIITQSEKENGKYCDEIRSVLRRNNVHWKEYKNNHNGTVNFRFAFALGREIKRSFPYKIPTPSFALNITKAQSRIFIDTFAKGDGWCDQSGTWAITQKDKNCIDVLCMIAVLGGYSPSILKGKNHDWYTMRLTQFKSVETNELRPKKVKYRGIIWCPSTKNGTFYARRNGHCYWTGNTLPTDADTRTFVGGKVNRIIANNKSMLDDVADKDSIEQKQVGDSMIYFRGTWTKKAAIMVTADRLVHDEKDSSKLDVIADYQARLQHSKFKQIHTFSHPSLPETGVHVDWLKSDQKHWLIKCPSCAHWQYLSWNTEDPSKMSIDIEKKIYVCKRCRGMIPNYARREGQWVAKYKDRPWSGYWVPLLIAPYMSAADIIAKYQDPETTPEFFWTKVLGLPFADATSKLLRQSFFQNLTGKLWAPHTDERVIIGIDTGLRLDYVIGNKQGLFFQGDCNDYGELDNLMNRWPKAIAIIDAGGDLIGSRAFAERHVGRVFLCYLGGDRKTNEIASWKKKDEHGAVHVDRNRMIQLVVDEFRNKRIPVHGTEADWFEYWLDWNNLSKMKVLDPDTNQVKGYKWVRNGRDHRALATVFWRVGMTRFAGMGGIVNPQEDVKPNSYMIEPNQTVKFDPKEFFDKVEDQENEDWRVG